MFLYKKYIKKFKNREIKAKDTFDILEISKSDAYSFIRKYHYLKNARFFAHYSYGLYVKGVLVGCATYTNPQGSKTMQGWFGLSNDDPSVLELSRLCMLPSLNGSNATSYLLSNSMKLLKKVGIRAVITLADDSRHIGSIYQVCNFKYYGLTKKKTDFFGADGNPTHRRKTKNVSGVYLPRTQKHRYAYILDKKLKILLDECERPKDVSGEKYICCNGTMEVYDSRFNKNYTCPKCTGEIKEIIK